MYEEVQLRWGRESGYQLPGMADFEDLGGRGVAVFRGVAGTMLQVDLGLTRPASLLLEYFYNGDGLSTDEARRFASLYAAWQDSGSRPASRCPAFSRPGRIPPPLRVCRSP